jgi:uncharacterized coiled-coil protein SlyX
MTRCRAPAIAGPPVTAPAIEGQKRRMKDYTSRMDDDMLEQIQTKIAFLERTSAELSDVLFRQHRELQALEAKLKAITDRLSGAQSEDSPRPPEQERPPHY